MSFFMIYRVLGAEPLGEGVDRNEVRAQGKAFPYLFLEPKTWHLEPTIPYLLFPESYFTASKIISAMKIAARIHVTTGISFAFFPAHLAIT